MTLTPLPWVGQGSGLAIKKGRSANQKFGDRESVSDGFSSLASGVFSTSCSYMQKMRRCGLQLITSWSGWSDAAATGAHFWQISLACPVFNAASDSLMTMFIHIIILPSQVYILQPQETSEPGISTTSLHHHGIYLCDLRYSSLLIYHHMEVSTNSASPPNHHPFIHSNIFSSSNQPVSGSPFSGNLPYFNRFPKKIRPTPKLGQRTHPCHSQNKGGCRPWKIEMKCEKVHFQHQSITYCRSL